MPKKSITAGLFTTHRLLVLQLSRFVTSYHCLRCHASRDHKNNLHYSQGCHRCCHGDPLSSKSWHCCHGNTGVMVTGVIARCPSPGRVSIATPRHASCHMTWHAKCDSQSEPYFYSGYIAIGYCYYVTLHHWPYCCYQSRGVLCPIRDLYIAANSFDRVSGIFMRKLAAIFEMNFLFCRSHICFFPVAYISEPWI